MGLLRLILALAVIATHSTRLLPFSILPGSIAVQTFYIISGFYMAMILSEKYKPGAYRLFITNRILRIYPLYILVVVLSLAVFAVGYFGFGHHNALGRLIDHTAGASLAENLLIYGSMIFVFGQDVLLFVTEKPSWNIVLVPQAWTLSLELMFYLIAPFLVRCKNRHLIGLFLASVCLRGWLVAQGLHDDRWSYRFFPNELALFLIGIFSFRWYQWVRPRPVPGPVQGAVFGVVIALTIFLTVIPLPPLFKVIFYFVLMGAALPFVFHFTRTMAWDRWLGDFSYPMYIVHALVGNILVDYGIVAGVSDPRFGWMLAAGSFVASFIFLHALIYPVERLRAGRVLDHKL